LRHGRRRGQIQLGEQLRQKTGGCKRRLAQDRITRIRQALNGTGNPGEVVSGDQLEACIPRIGREPRNPHAVAIRQAYTPKPAASTAARRPCGGTRMPVFSSR
tara:strand:- start:231 stop:539 length:309 start_codon:yes stop_codon:yes gene_type:complete